MKNNQSQSQSETQSSAPAENAGMVYGSDPGQTGAQAGMQSTAQTGMQSSMHTETQAGQAHVVAVRKNGDGDIVELKLSSGQVVDYKTAQVMAKNEQIAHVQVIRGRDNEEHLRSTPDDRKDNNLDNLPTF